MASSSGRDSSSPAIAMVTEMAAKKVALVPTTRLVSARSLAPMHWPMRMVAAIATPKAAPISRNITVLALEVAVSAASPRKRPTQMEFTEALSDCRMLANRIGSVNLNSPRAIGPSVSVPCMLAIAPLRVRERCDSCAEQQPARPRRAMHRPEPQHPAEQQRGAQGENITPACGAAQLGTQSLELEQRARPLRRVALALHQSMQRRGRAARRLDEPGRVVAQIAQQVAYADTLAHPASQDGAGGAPDIQLRIQLAPQALDVEQRLLQQNQLRLDLHIEAARDLEQPQQDAAEGDVLQRPVEDRLEHGAHRRLHLFDARIGGHPAGLEVQLGHAAVVAVEDREEVLRQVVLVARIERADDAEVDGRVARVLRILRQHEDVPRVHVGVEEIVAEHLGEED